MLPSKGYFHDIECPYYDNQCGRPYCHFRHRKKQEIEEKMGNINVPTYKPTPKSELMSNKNHIPISYVPDLAFRQDRPLRNRILTFEKPIYKPTPISLLASTKQIESLSNKDVNDLKEKISQSEYEPDGEIKSDVSYNPTSLSDSVILKNFSKSEYVPEGDSENNHKYEPTALGTIQINDNKSSMEYDPSKKNKLNIDFEELGNEFEMIEELICDEKPQEKLEIPPTSENKSKKVHSSDRKKPDDKKDKCKEKSKGLKEKHNEREKSKEKTKDEKRSKSKHSDKRDYKTNESKDIKISKEKLKEDKNPRDKKTYTGSNYNSKHKSKKTSSSNKDKKRDKSKEDSKDKNDNRKKSEKSKSDKDINKSKKSTKSEKSERVRKHSETSDDLKHHVKKPRKEKIFIKNEEPSKSEKDSLYSLNDFDETFEDEDETMLECYKIFNEYHMNPEDTKAKEEPVEKAFEVKQNDDSALMKKRVAHSNALFSLNKLPTQNKPSITNVGQSINQRYKTRILEIGKQETNEQKLITNETKINNEQSSKSNMFKDVIKINKAERQANIKNLKPSTSIIDDILNTKKNKPVHKKFSIAPVNNVLNIQRAKAQLQELSKKCSTETVRPTLAQTSKGKREAHVPGYTLGNIPDVIDSDKSKLPVNVRTRFLTTIAEECCKLYLVQADAFKRALNEEYCCYQKCKVLATYKNSAMVAVSKIRKEIKERENKGLGLMETLAIPNSTNNSYSEKCDFYNRIKEWVLGEEELILHGFPRESKNPGHAVIQNKKSSVISLPKNQRKCCRCSKIYLVNDDGGIIYKEECIYHPLKKRTLRGQQTYLCCKSVDDTGCVTSHTHVSEISEEAALEGFQTTMPPDKNDDQRSVAVYALDCEMCYTTKGLELTRVTIVDKNCKTVYESLVKPLNDIIDYNTRFSGITKEIMDRTSTGILQVQANILHLCNSNTILIGHSLESDMKALKIIHNTIIDTSVLFPHKMGLPHKRALKALASEYLQKIIQNDINGHDSAEDAITCMELIHWKLKEKCKGYK